MEKKDSVIRVDLEEWKDRLKKLAAFRDLVARHIDEATEKQEKHYNCGKRVVSFHIGDMVMRRSHVLSNAAQKFSAKLAPKYDRSFRVVQMLSPTVYLLEMDSEKRNAKVHVSEIKRYVPPRVVAT